MTANRIPYATGTALTTSANLTYDGTTLAVGGAVTIGTTLAVTGTLKTTNIGFGGTTPNTFAGIYTAADFITGASQYGILYDGVLSGTTESNVIALTLAAKASTTITLGRGLYIAAATLGASAAITTNVGLDIGAQTVGGTNFAIRTGTGNVKFGSLAGSGSRTVVADANGVLSAP